MGAPRKGAEMETEPNRGEVWTNLVTGARAVVTTVAEEHVVSKRVVSCGEAGHMPCGSAHLEDVENVVTKVEWRREWRREVLRIDQPIIPIFGEVKGG